MKKKFLVPLLLLACILACAFGFAACKVHATSITLNKTELILEVGQEETLTATISPDNATYTNIVWSVGKTGVVSVSDGKVKALSEGTTTITATVEDKSAACTVKVIKD